MRHAEKTLETIYRVESYDAGRYQTLKESWDDLFSSTEQVVPYLSFTWIDSFIQHKRYKGTVIILTVWFGGRLVVVWPLSLWKLWGIKIAQPVSTGMHVYLGVLIDPAHLNTLRHLANYIISRQVFDVYVSNDLSSLDLPTWNLIKELHRQNMRSVHVYRTVCHFIRLGCSYQDYLNKTKTKKRQKQLRYEEKKLHAYGQVKIHRFNREQITGTILERALNIQQSSWMVKKNAAFLTDPFNRSLLFNMARENFGQLWIMTINDQDAAFVFALRNQNRLEYFLTAFTLEFDRSLSIGKMLTQQVIRDACQEGIKVLNFGQTDALYKQFWGTHQHQVYRIAAGKGPAGRLLTCAYWAAWKLYGIKYIKRTYQKLKKTLSKNP